MCGLAGFFRNSGAGHRDAEMGWLQAMGEALIHRGPDSGDSFADDDIALTHRRLSILDLSSAGSQPMVSRSGRYVIVFNGEIYNFQELRAELEAEGHVFHTHTDTEVLLVLYEQEGEACLRKLNGMFAFAIWDNVSKHLFVARDRLGKKPLYYYVENGQFAFASEIKSLLKLPFVIGRLRLDSVKDFFAYQYIPDPKTIYENIYKLKPGHWLITDGKTITENKYWDLEFSENRIKDPSTLQEQLLELVSNAVRLRMVSDVPLGAFLSGGIDSSAIVALMSRLSENPVTTCSIGFDSEKFDEVHFAQKVAGQFHTDHHEFTVREDVSSAFAGIASYFDEPFADPSFVPTYFVSKLARQRVTVALAGDGGDENFAGYEKYYVDSIENKLRSVFPRLVRQGLFPFLSSCISFSDIPTLRKGRSLLNALAMEPDRGFFNSNCFFDSAVWDYLVDSGFDIKTGDYNPADITCRYYKDAPAEDHLSKILYTDFKTYLPGDILVKVDRMSMANSLETRAPLLDYRVVEFAASIPSSLKLRGKEKKYILKKGFSGLLTDEILYRKKMGFSVPLAEWLRTELRATANAVFMGRGDGLAEIFRMDRVRELWEAHLRGNSRYTQELWSMLMFSVWYQRYGG